MTSPADRTAIAAEFAAEFDVLTARMDIDVPADLKDGVVRGYQGLRAMTLLLREAGTRQPDGKGDAG